MEREQDHFFFVEKSRGEKVVLKTILQEGKITIHLHNPFYKSCILVYWVICKNDFFGEKRNEK